MNRETLYVMDIDVVPAVVANRVRDAEHYRRLHKVGYRQITFGVGEEEATNFAFVTFAENRADDVANAYAGEVIHIDWSMAPFRLSSPFGYADYMVLLPREAKKVADVVRLPIVPVKVVHVHANTEDATELMPVINTILHRFGRCETDYTDCLPYPFRIGAYRLRPTRYEMGVYVAMREAGLPVVAFGDKHISLLESAVIPAPAVYPAEYSLTDLLRLLVKEWNRFGCVEVLPYLAEDAVIAYENSRGEYVNMAVSHRNTPKRLMTDDVLTPTDVLRNE